MTELQEPVETSTALFPTASETLAKRSPIACVDAVKSLLAVPFKPVIKPNRLLKSARLLLSFASACRGSDSPVKESALEPKLVEAVHQFMVQAKENGYAHFEIMAARYLLCALLDELIVASDWKVAAKWRESGGLLAVFAQEPASSGRFFQVIKRCCDSPAAHFDLLEVGYYCLSAGFMGEYRQQAGGLQCIAHMRDQLYQIIVHYRGEVRFDLQLGDSPWIPRRRSWVSKFLRARAMGVVWLMVLLSLGVLFLPYQHYLQKMAQPVAAHLQSDLTSQTPAAALLSHHKTNRVRAHKQPKQAVAAAASLEKEPSS